MHTCQHQALEPPRTKQFGASVFVSGAEDQEQDIPKSSTFSEGSKDLLLIQVPSIVVEGTTTTGLEGLLNIPKPYGSSRTEPQLRYDWTLLAPT